MTVSVEKSHHKYTCEPCDYKCSSLKDYNKHLSTRKHKKMTIVDTNDDNNSKKSPNHKCENCGKQYAHRQGLFVHKKKCKQNDFSNIEKLINTNTPINDRDIIELLIKQNLTLLEIIKK